ncbi:MAG: ATP-dependent helicase HrpB [Bryobacterales bacterium]|nr:ATP-dependent helicase HrpB [Bryobacterales bacterium]
MVSLPVDALLPEILATLKQSNALVLEAPPGAGKTTRVPPALLELGMGEVWVLEPRRLAARLAARRVAEELGEPLGRTVGYQVRFEQVASASTRLRFLTEGVLTRRMISDPELRGAGIIVLDEFHERHLDSDLALAWLKRLQRTSRPGLRVVVMSATLHAAPIAQFLGECPVLRSEGRLFEMSVRYRPHSAEPLEEQVRSATEQLLTEQPLTKQAKGDILVFLPGAAEIQRASRALEATARRFDLLVTPLHGDLSPEEQDRAVQPSSRRKVILSTNVAESSVTIEGVTAVVDSGLARIASHSPWSGLPVLQTGRISQASATQRAGRSARTAPGRVIRLYPEEDFLRRPHHDLPEILRMDLAEIALTLEALGLRHFNELEWLDTPPAPAVEAAEQLLQRLGALDEDGRLNTTGRAMLACPLPPRLARMVIEADRRGAGDDGALAAALLSLGARLPNQPRHKTPSDVFALMEGDHPPSARRLASSVRNALRIKQTGRPDDDALRMSILAAFPDRVARRRPNDELLLSGGGSAILAKSSTVRDGAYLVAIDIEDRKERGLPLVRLASSIEPDWLLDLFPDRITERNGVEWNRTGERVEAVSAMLYESLVIDESRGGTVDPGLASQMLSAKAREQALHRFIPEEERLAFLARTGFASQWSSIPKWTDEDLWSALDQLCVGKRSFTELLASTRDGGLAAHLISTLPHAQQRALEELAPLRWKLPSGRTGRIEYSDGQTPKLSARLQEFFGMKETPRIGGGKVALVLELLAPNQRPVQTTTDLAGFWNRWYPTVRKELMRRYPKHAWPEKPE